MAKPTDPNQAMRRATPPLWIILLGLLGLVLMWGLVASLLREEPNEIPYSQLKERIREGQVAEVTLRGDTIAGRFVRTAGEGAAPERQAAETPAGGTGEGPDAEDAAPELTPALAGEPFVTVIPAVADAGFMQLLEDNGVTVRAESAEPAWWLRATIGLLPWLLILGLFLYVTYRMQKSMVGGEGGPGGVFKFAKSKAKRFREEATKTTFDDVAGLDNAKQDLREIVDHLANPERYRALGAKIPKGVLLVGSPGTGKTLLARAVAGEARVPFYSTGGSELVEMFVGVGAARVRDMFESAKKESPSVIFIDEIDAVGRSRGAGVGGGHDEREQTLNQILSEMDGFEPNRSVVVLAATNRPDVLDSALLRPGRFDRKVYLDMPDRKAREAILAVHTRGVPLAEDVDLARIAGRTVGFSGADLENLVNEAALFAGRERKSHVDMRDFEQARDKLVLGAERERGLSEDERRLVAYHESGHALMAWLLPHADPFERMTIIPRGRSLGATEQLPEEERVNVTAAYLRDRIGVMLGGRVAEQVVFGEVTSGSEADLEQATKLARRMVCRWGMSDALGPVSVARGQEHVFLGKEIADQQDFSDATARIIDREVKRLLDEAERNDRRLMERHRDLLDRLGLALLEEETIGRERIAALLGERGARPRDLAAEREAEREPERRTGTEG